MNVKELKYERTFNLGNYESERIGLTIEPFNEKPLKEQFRALKKAVFLLHDTPEDERIEKAREKIGKDPYRQENNQK